MKRFLPLLFLCLSFQLTAQKACFIKGGFMAAFYSQHDQKIKLVNTFTNQVFYWYEYKGPEPMMWFADNLLVVIDNSNVAVSNFQTGKKENYTLAGKPIPNTLFQLMETDGAISITHIITQKQSAYLQKPAGARYVAAAISNNQECLAIHWKKEDRQLMCVYNITDTLQTIWQQEASGNNELAFVLNNNGDHIAIWNGKETVLIETTTGKELQTIKNPYRCLRFTPKDELICTNKSNQSASLYTKNKEGLYKSTFSNWFKNGNFLSSDRQEAYIEWDESFVSDDLLIAIGFGQKAVALFKNGPAFLFFNQK